MFHVNPSGFKVEPVTEANALVQVEVAKWGLLQDCCSELALHLRPKQIDVVVSSNHHEVVARTDEAREGGKHGRMCRTRGSHFRDGVPLPASNAKRVLIRRKTRVIHRPKAHSGKVDEVPGDD
jgi:hypothetical protein